MLEITEVEVHYGKVQALKQVNLSVGEGEIVTLIGANGAGKSTTLNTVSGMVRASRGEILFKGERIDRLPAYTIVERGITQVPEGRRLFPGMSVEENLRIGAHIIRDQALIRKRLSWVKELFPILNERSKQLAGTLSGGEQQMAAIGRGLMASPKLMLLDEPSLGLAPLIVKEIPRIIREIHRQGLSILLVEQNANMALRVAHRGYVLETGRIVKADSSSGLLQSDDVRRAYLGK